MDYIYIKKPKKGLPSLNWTSIITNENRPFTFDLKSLNFNTFIRAFAHNQIQWRYIENKLCNYFRVENGDMRIVDCYPGEVETEEDSKHFIQRIWRVANNIANEMHII